MRPQDDVVDRIAREIQEWLTRNPGAADTLDGIRDFWLTGETRHQPKQLVNDALNILCARGVVEEKRQREGIASLYCSAIRKTDT